MISNDLRERVLRLAARERVPTRSQARRAGARTLLAAAGVAIAVLALAGGLRPSGRSPELMLATFLPAAAIAAAASWIALRRGASMLGRPGETLVALLVVVPFALLAAKLGLTAGWSGMSAPWPDRPGLRCLGLSLALGAAPLAAYLWVWRHRDVPRPGLQGAALGVAAAALVWPLLDVWCPVGHPAHLAFGHLSSLALLATAGAAWRALRPGGCYNTRDGASSA